MLAVNISRKYRVPIIAYSGATSLERHHVAVRSRTSLYLTSLLIMIAFNRIQTAIGGICVDVSGMNSILQIHGKTFTWLSYSVAWK